MASSANDDNPRSVKRVAVVGAGVSGLAAAYKLKSHGLDVTVFEAEGRAGGRLRSISQDGLVWDEGANTMTESEIEVKSLIDALGLQEKQQFPISQHKRYIVKNGTPLLVPTNPAALLKSTLLSAQSKIQVIFEPFMCKRSDPSNVCHENSEESVGSFFERHFGKEVVDYLIDPFVGGTSAADPESLSNHLLQSSEHVFSIALLAIHAFSRQGHPFSGIFRPISALQLAFSVVLPLLCFCLPLLCLQTLCDDVIVPNSDIISVTFYRKQLRRYALD